MGRDSWTEGGVEKEGCRGEMERQNEGGKGCVERDGGVVQRGREGCVKRKRVRGCVEGAKKVGEFRKREVGRDWVFGERREGQDVWRTRDGMCEEKK